MYQICTENPDALEAGGAEARVRGFGFSSDDTIYAAAEDGSVHRLSYPVWGDVPLKTTPGVSYTALAVHPTTGELWAAARGAVLGTRLDQIYKVDNLTGMGTFVGYTGDSVITSSLAFDADGLLYGLKRGGQRNYLVRIDTLTGEGSIVLKLGEYNLIAMAMRSDSLRVVSVEDEGIALPQEYALHQNYPNPFNPSTTIEFALPQSSSVSLEVFNVLGEEVTTLVDTEMRAGSHRVLWDASGKASGVYFYRLTAGEYAETRRMLLLR